MRERGSGCVCEIDRKIEGEREWERELAGACVR